MTQAYTREDLDTRGIAVAEVADLCRCENPNFQAQVGEIMARKRDQYAHSELFSEWVNYTTVIDCDPKHVFEYLKNPFSLEEFSATVRGVEPVGDGLYRAMDVLSPDTSIYLRFFSHAESGVVDCHCAWDSSNELWMRYHQRVLDARPTLGRPGAVLLWNNCRHPYYSKDNPAPEHVDSGRKRTDRPWVGDFWDHFYDMHAVEARNLQLILEARFGKG